MPPHVSSAALAPNWMDGPMLYRDNPVAAAPGMVFIMHMVIFDDDTGLAATPGRTGPATDTGAGVLSKAGTEFVVR